MAFVHEGLTFRLKKQVPDRTGVQKVTLLVKTPDAKEQSIGTFLEAADAQAYAKVYATEQAHAQQQEVPAQRTEADLCGVSLSEYFHQTWIKQRVLTVSSRSGYESSFRLLEPTFGNMDIRQITFDRVTDWVSRALDEGETAHNVARAVKALGTILAAKEGASAMRAGHCLVNPVYQVTRPQVQERDPEIYTPEEMDKLLPCASHWYRPLLEMAYASGARRSELRGLRVRDLNVKANLVHLHRPINEAKITTTGTGTRFYIKPSTKGNKGRTVAIDAEVMQRMVAMIEERHLGPDDLLFAMSAERKQTQQRRARQAAILDFVGTTPGATVQMIADAVKAKYDITRLDVKVLKDEGCLGNIEALNGWQDRFVLRTKERARCVEIARTEAWPDGVPFANNWLAKEWKATVTASGLPWRRPHDIRATAISEILGGSADTQAAMAFAGHQDWKTTRRYNVAHNQVHEEQRNARARTRGRYAETA